MQKAQQSVIHTLSSDKHLLMLQDSKEIVQ